MKAITLTIDILNSSYVVRASRPGETRHFREDVAVSLEALGELVISLTASEQLSDGPSKEEIADEDERHMLRKVESLLRHHGRDALQGTRLPPGYSVEYSLVNDILRLHTPSGTLYDLPTHPDLRIHPLANRKNMWV